MGAVKKKSENTCTIATNSQCDPSIIETPSDEQTIRSILIVEEHPVSHHHDNNNQSTCIGAMDQTYGLYSTEYLISSQ
eukprot:9165319-Ditylum_brightwellii.AAC.1